MGKKMWSVMFLAICLAFAFGVGPLEAQCQPCDRCDRDGDGLIKDSGGCRNRCGTENLDPDDSDADHCSGGEGGSEETITYDVFAHPDNTVCIGSPFMATTSGGGPECGVGAPGAEISSGGVEAFNIFYCDGFFRLTLEGADGPIVIVRAASNMGVDDGEATQFGFTMYDSDGNSYESIGQIPVTGDSEYREIKVGEDFLIDVNQESFPVQISKKSAHGDRERDRGTICIGTLLFTVR